MFIGDKVKYICKLVNKAFGHEVSFKLVIFKHFINSPKFLFICVTAEVTNDDDTTKHLGLSLVHAEG